MYITSRIFGHVKLLYSSLVYITAEIMNYMSIVNTFSTIEFLNFFVFSMTPSSNFVRARSLLAEQFVSGNSN